MPALKPANIDDYISGFPASVQKMLQEMRRTISEEAPGAEETISYAIPTFRMGGNLVHFAAFKSHIGFYPAPTGTEAFKKDLSNYKTGKGSVQFPLDQPLPLQLIRKMVRWRLNELKSKQKPG